MAKVRAAGVAGIRAVGITMFVATSCSLGISLAKGMNIQDNQRIA